MEPPSISVVGMKALDRAERRDAGYRMSPASTCNAARPGQASGLCAENTRAEANRTDSPGSWRARVRDLQVRPPGRRPVQGRSTPATAPAAGPPMRIQQYPAPPPSASARLESLLQCDRLHGCRAMRLRPLWQQAAMMISCRRHRRRASRGSSSCTTLRTRRDQDRRSDAELHGFLDDPARACRWRPRPAPASRAAAIRARLGRSAPVAGRGARTLDAQATAELSSAPVEDSDRSAFPQSQYTHRVVRDLMAAGAPPSSEDEVGVDVKAGKRHEFSLGDCGPGATDEKEAGLRRPPGLPPSHPQRTGAPPKMTHAARIMRRALGHARRRRPEAAPSDSCAKRGSVNNAGCIDGW